MVAAFAAASIAGLLVRRAAWVATPRESCAKVLRSAELQIGLTGGVMKRFRLAAWMLALCPERYGRAFGATSALLVSAAMALALCGFAAEAAPQARITQWSLSGIPATIGINVRVDSSGPSPVVWATTGQQNPQLIRFDPAVATWKAWDLAPALVNAGGIALAPDGRVFVKTQTDVQRIDPVTNARTRWADPSSNNAGSDIALAQDGAVWSAPGGSLNLLQRLVPQGVSDAHITQWNVGATGEITLAGIRVHPSNGKIYFAMTGTWQIGEFDPATNELRSWSVAPVGAHAPRQIDIDAAGAIWAVTASSHIVRLRADSNEMTSFVIPTGGADPYGISAQGTDGRIAFTELGARKVALLQPASALTATVLPSGPTVMPSVFDQTVTGVQSAVTPTNGSASRVMFDRGIGQTPVAGSLFDEVDVSDVASSPFGIDRDRSSVTPAYFYAGLAPLISHVTFDLAGSSAPNLIQNGSFELGAPPNDPCNSPLSVGSTAITGWTVLADNIEWIDTCSWNASQGTRSLDLVGTTKVGGVQQTFATVAGETYRVTFDLAGNYGTATGSPPVKPLEVTVARATGGLDPLPGNGATHTFNFDFNQTAFTQTLPLPPYGSIVVDIRASSPTQNNTLTVDFYSEPSSVGLLLTETFNLDLPLDTSLFFNTFSGLNDGVFSIGIRSTSAATLEGLRVTGSPSTSAFNDPGPFSVFTKVPFGDKTQTYTFDTSGHIPPAPMGWVTKTFDFNAETSSTTLRFVSDMAALAGSHAGAAIDNVRVVPASFTPAASTTGLASSLNPSGFGSAVTFTVQVQGTVNSSDSPTGSIAFTDGGSPIGGCTAVPLGPTGTPWAATAACTISSLAVGTHTIAATYSGDVLYAGSSDALPQVIDAVAIGGTPWTGSAGSVTNQGAPIGSSPTVVNDGTAGAAAVFTYATVNDYCCHTGDWTFETIATTTGPVTLNWSYSGYHGTCQAVATLTPYAKYNGGTTFGAPVYNAADTCSGQPPSGGFGMEGQVTLNAVAGYAYGFRMYASNYDSNGGVQGRLTVTMGTLPTTTTLATSANPASNGNTVSFTATVAGNAPTGTMMFTRETRVLPQGPAVLGCEAVPLVGGSAVCSTNFLFPGNNNIVALYSGDSVNAGSVSATLQQVINAPILATPVLIRAAPSGVVPPLIGRVDGGVNMPITVRLFGGTSCADGVLGGTIAQLGTDESVTTDANGYFGTQQTGAQGQFVAIGLVSPQVTPLSNCVVSAADNDTWPKALSLTGNSVTVPDWIDAAGKARWYRFGVIPGQSIQVTISGLPADYDLAVFKDIAVEFGNELVPATTADLTRLSAQYAPSAFSPSAFSPSAFSPSAFSPSAFSPSAFSPSAFSPSAFSPSAFSPSAFSPSAFSPSAFSPSAFSPSAFSPSAFSPSAFSPSAFSPSAFSPTELQQAFSAAQTRSIIATSMTPGTGNESVVVNTWNNTGNFYVRVTGRAGAFSPAPYNLALSKQGTSCTNVTDTAISSTRTAAPSGYNTIILVDSGNTPLSATVPGQPLDNTLGRKLANFAARSEIKGVIVDVALDGRVGTLKAQAQASSNVGCPFAKNLVALEIRSIIDAYRMANPLLRYVVIVGNDDAIPFFRYPDQTLLGKESGFVPPVSSSSASEASLRGNFVLSQDHYGATNSISLGMSEFPIPGMAVGRLIETPVEIAGMIDAYVTVSGSVRPTSSLVTGYDFLQDAAEAVRGELQSGTGNASDFLITPNNVSPADTRTYANGGPWTASNLRDKLLTARHDVMFLAGHFSANSALAADFSTSLLTSDLAASPFLANSLVFSAGCHAGYNIVDTDAINGVTFPLDWAQAWAQQKVTLVAGTGYQYGDTEFLEYSERLYLNFARELRADTGNIAIGEALVKAKLAYLRATPDLRGLHEKAVLEATLFGLPMLGVNMPAGRGGNSAIGGVINTVPPSVSGPGTTLGLRLADLAVSPTLTATGSCPTCGPHTLNLTNYDLPLPNATTATWISGPDGVVTNPAEPALPLQIVNVTPINSALVLRGIGFRGATYSDSTVVPLTGAPATEIRGVHTPFSSPLFFPMRLWTTNYFSALSGGGGTSLLVTPAQHKSLEGTNSSTLRQYTSLDLRLFYSDLTTTSNPGFAAAVLSGAPTIVRVDAGASGGVTTFSAQVVGDPAAAVHEVWVTYTSGAGGDGAWTTVNLQQCGIPLPAACGTTADSQYWKARVTTTLPADTRYIVQAVNGVGLVSLDDNLGRYYSLVSSAPVATAISFNPPPPTTAVFGDSLSITAVLSSGGSPLPNKVVTIAVGGGARTGMTDSSGSVTVLLPMLAAPGSYPLSASFGGDSASLPSAVSSSSAVTVTKSAAALTLPPSGVGVVLTAGSRPLIQESIQVLISGPAGTQQLFAITDYKGVATIPPPGFPSGTYSVIQACFAGNATYAAAKLNPNLPCSSIVAPVIGSVMGPAGPVPKGTAVTIKASFTDVGSLDTHTCTFVWDDASATTTVAAAGTGNGSCTASHTYATAGVYEPQVTVKDNDGAFMTSSLQYVVVYDASAGFVTGGGWINSPPGAYAANLNLTGKANFGFVSKYKNGMSVPTGQTEFNFNVANFKFNSTAYEWLVISGAKAQYKGTGTVNGAGSYNFILTAWDGGVSGGGGIDKFRIRIYAGSQANMIYDNQLGAPDNDDPTTALGGGSIVIHK